LIIDMNIPKQIKTTKIINKLKDNGPRKGSA
jgi:hypothetical protein